LQAKRAVADFVATHQGMDPAQLQREFIDFLRVLNAAPPPAPGMMTMQRRIKTGGHNE
jgi:hypothetical protein